MKVYRAADCHAIAQEKALRELTAKEAKYSALNEFFDQDDAQVEQQRERVDRRILAGLLGDRAPHASVPVLLLNRLSSILPNDSTFWHHASTVYGGLSRPIDEVALSSRTLLAINDASTLLLGRPIVEVRNGSLRYLGLWALRAVKQNE
jgi:hypothetical protein